MARQHHLLAAVRIAVEMAEAKLIGKDEAVLRVDPEALNHLLRPVFDALNGSASYDDIRLVMRHAGLR